MMPIRRALGTRAARGWFGSTPALLCVLPIRPCRTSLNMPSPPTQTTLREQHRHVRAPALLSPQPPLPKARPGVPVRASVSLTAGHSRLLGDNQDGPQYGRLSSHVLPGAHVPAPPPPILLEQLASRSQLSGLGECPAPRHGTATRRPRLPDSRRAGLGASPRPVSPQAPLTFSSPTACPSLQASLPKYNQTKQIQNHLPPDQGLWELSTPSRHSGNWTDPYDVTAAPSMLTVSPHLQYYP